MVSTTTMLAGQQQADRVSLARIYHQAGVLMLFIRWGLLLISALLGWFFAELQLALIAGGDPDAQRHCC